MKTHAFFAAALLTGVALLPFPAGAAEPEAAEETFVTEEVQTEVEGEAPAQTIDLSGFQETDLPDEPIPHFSDNELLQGQADWAEEPAGPPKKGTADHLRQAVRMRQIRTIAQRDPVIRQEKARAAAARTPEGRRTLLRNYYVLLYNRMVQLEPSFKEPLEADLIVKLSRLEQRRIRPSVLVEPYQPLPGSRVVEKTVEVTTTTETTTSEE